MNMEGARLQVRRCIRAVVESGAPITDSSRLVEDIGLTSLSFIELLVEIECSLGLAFPDEYLVEKRLVTVGDLVSLVARLGLQSEDNQQDIAAPPMEGP